MSGDLTGLCLYILSKYTLLFDNKKQFYAMFNVDLWLIKHIQKLYSKVDWYLILDEYLCHF